MSDTRHTAVVRKGEVYQDAAGHDHTAPHDGLLLNCTYVPADTAVRLLRMLGWACVRTHRCETPVVVQIPTVVGEIIDGLHFGETKKGE